MSFLNGPAPIHDANVVRNIQMKQPSVFLVCKKSKNKNVAVYEVLHKDGKLCDPPITGYCLVLDTGANYQPKRRSQGIQHDRSEFNALDLQFAWGYASTRLSDTTAEFWFTMFPDKRFQIVFDPKDSNRAKMYADHQGRKYRLQSMYVEASEHFHIVLRNNIKQLYFEGLDITTNPPKKATIYWS